MTKFATKLVFSLFLSFLFFRIFSLVTLNFPDESTIRAEGLVSDIPKVLFDKQIIRLGKLTAEVKSEKQISYGDFVVVEGVVKDNKIINAAVLEHYSNGNVFSAFHTRLVSVVNQSLPEPHSALVAGIVLGDKQNLGSEFYDQLKLTGTAHVVVASGMNVTLVGGFVLSILLNFLNRKKAVLLAIVLIWIYVLIAGIDAPLIRAGIMGTIAFVAMATGRLNSAIRALFISLLLMLFVFPWWIYDIGLWLSFAATMSLILFESRVARLITFVPKIIRDDLSTSLAAQVGVAPILLISFGSVSLIAPFVNAIVLWTIPLITIIGMLGSLVGIIFLPLGKLILLLTYPLTLWFVEVVNLFS